MPIGGDEGIDRVAIEVFEIAKVNHDIPHVIFNEESDGVFQLGRVKDFSVGESGGDNVENANGSDIELDKLPPREPRVGSLALIDTVLSRPKQNHTGFINQKRGLLSASLRLKATKFPFIMPDEERYPTMRFHTCPGCGHVFTGSLTGVNTCPRCHQVIQVKTTPVFFLRENHGDHVAFRIHGSHYRIGDLAEIKAHLQALESLKPPSIAFIFDGESVLDSGFLNLMAKTVYGLSQTGGRVFVVTHYPHLMDSLQVMGLDRVVTVLQTEKDYLQAIQKLAAL